MLKKPLRNSSQIDTYFFPSIEQSSCTERPLGLENLALRAYIYGYPLVLMELTKKSMLASGMRMNQFAHQQTFPTPDFTTIIRPNVDTLYSLAWLDLTEEPILLKVPDTQDRYSLMELSDAWTNVFASIGTRTTDAQPGTYAITGPNWNGKLPEGTINIDSPTNTVFIIGRIQTNGPADYPAVQQVQNAYHLMPVSSGESFQLPKQSTAPKETPSASPLQQLEAISAASFFQTMNRAMRENPPWIADPKINRILAILDINSREVLHFDFLSSSVKQALEFAVIRGPEFIKDASRANYMRQAINGWGLYFKNMGFYGADYLRRAIVAMSGTGANLPKDAVYAPTFTDVSGQPFHGRKRYLWHLNQKQIPPVQAFWSLTVYNQQGYLADNPLHRYAISPHLSPLHYEDDGSLKIWIGSIPPAEEFRSNWLPTPDGPFNLLLRMYWPESAVINGRWIPPAVVEG
ncbi:MAG TPA: hypothetical protein DDW50_07575 [Firmicutes bacterium]|jgi:hypothetical protein|nr:hypothetical protein [Bacillota bacterium]